MSRPKTPDYLGLGIQASADRQGQHPLPVAIRPLSDPCTLAGHDIWSSVAKRQARLPSVTTAASGPSVGIKTWPACSAPMYMPGGAMHVPLTASLSPDYFQRPNQSGQEARHGRVSQALPDAVTDWRLMYRISSPRGSSTLVSISSYACLRSQR